MGNQLQYDGQQDDQRSRTQSTLQIKDRMFIQEDFTFNDPLENMNQGFDPNLDYDQEFKVLKDNMQKLQIQLIEIQLNCEKQCQGLDGYVHNQLDVS
ncbi:hypothetical protein pb186bvf_015773 [Paramecium bursaria]